MMDDFIELIENRLQTKDEKAVQGAVATFLFKVMPVDGQTHPKELERLLRILCDDFSLEQEEAEDLIAHASEQASSAKKLAELAALLKDNATSEELLTLISHMWEMVFADGRMHETEILFVERVANLLDIPEKDVAKAMNI